MPIFNSFIMSDMLLSVHPRHRSLPTYWIGLLLKDLPKFFIQIEYRYLLRLSDSVFLPYKFTHVWNLCPHWCVGCVSFLPLILLFWILSFCCENIFIWFLLIWMKVNFFSQNQLWIEFYGTMKFPFHFFQETSFPSDFLSFRETSVGFEGGSAHFR